MPDRYDIPCNYQSLTPLDERDNLALKAGDIGFYIKILDGGISVSHTLMVGRINGGTVQVVHSTEDRGVHMNNVNPFYKALYFRFNGMPSVAEGASSLAVHWSKSYGEARNPLVGYSSASWQKVRGAKAMLGTSAFGSGARGRLAKYRKREHIAPKNAICSEMVILLYQLIVGIEEECFGFIMLDAKHSLPVTLALYLYNSPYWNLIGRGGR